MARRSIESISGVFDTDTGKLVGIYPAGTSDVSYLPTSENPVSGDPVSAVVDPVTRRIENSGPAGSSVIRELLRAIAAGGDGAIRQHPTLTATITQGGNGGSLPEAECQIYPPGVSSGNATQSSPKLMDYPAFKTVGPVTWFSYGGSFGSRNLSFPLYYFSGPIRTMFSGRIFKFFASGNTQKYIITLDGYLIGSYTSASGTSNAWISVDFGAQVTGELAIHAAVGALVVGAVSGDVTAYFTDPGPSIKAISFGDSYSGLPCSNINIGTGHPRSTLWRIGCKDTYVDQIGGTGYIRNNGLKNALTRMRESVARGEQWDVIDAQLGINDPLPNSYADLQVAVDTFYAEARAAWPSALIIAQYSWCPDETKAYDTGMNAQLVKSYVKAAVRRDKGPWILVDNLTGGWEASSGASSAGNGKSWQTGNGRRIDFTSNLTAAASGTLTTAWTGPTGSYNIDWADGVQRISVTLTNNSATVNFSTPPTTTTTVAGAYPAGSSVGRGNSTKYISSDGTHPIAPDGSDALEKMRYLSIKAALQSFI
jgi:hypothetical protein